MSKLNKRMKKIYEKLFLYQKFEIEEAISFLCENSYVNFTESLDIVIVLNLKNQKKSNQIISGSTILPYGYEKNVRIAAFIKDAKDIEIAKSFGIGLFGMEDLSEKIKKGERKFDVVLSSKEGMKIIHKDLSSILVAMGIMPNEKIGTVFTSNMQDAIQKIRKGFICYKIDKYGVIHASVGKINFLKNELRENIKFFVKSVKQLVAKKLMNISFKKIVLSTTMGCSVVLNTEEISF